VGQVVAVSGRAFVAAGLATAVLAGFVVAMVMLGTDALLGFLVGALAVIAIGGSSRGR